MVRYVADPHDDGIWCILDDGANCTLMGQTLHDYNRPETMPEFLFLGIDAELELLATFSQNAEATDTSQLGGL